MADTFKDIFNAMRQGNGNVVMRGSGTNATINGTDFSLNAPQTSTNKTYGTWKEWANDYFKPDERLKGFAVPTRIAKLGYEQGEKQAKQKRQFQKVIDQDDYETPEDWANAAYGEEGAKKIERNWRGEGLTPQAKATVDSLWDLLSEMPDEERKRTRRDNPYNKVQKRYYQANKGNRNRDNDFSAKYGIWGEESVGYPSQEAYDDMEQDINDFLKKYGN